MQLFAADVGEVARPSTPVDQSKSASMKAEDQTAADKALLQATNWAVQDALPGLPAQTEQVCFDHCTLWTAVYQEGSN